MLKLTVDIGADIGADGNIASYNKEDKKDRVINASPSPVLGTKNKMKVSQQLMKICTDKKNSEELDGNFPLVGEIDDC